MSDDARPEPAGEGSLRLSPRTLAAYAGAWGVVAAGVWATHHTSGITHTALVVASGLLGLYLLFLAASWVLLVGFVAWVNRGLSVGWVVISTYWFCGVVGFIVLWWLGLGPSGSEAWWVIGTYVVGGVVVTAVFGPLGRRVVSSRYRSPRGETS